MFQYQATSPSWSILVEYGGILEITPHSARITHIGIFTTLANLKRLMSYLFHIPILMVDLDSSYWSAFKFQRKSNTDLKSWTQAICYRYGPSVAASANRWSPWRWYSLLCLLYLCNYIIVFKCISIRKTWKCTSRSHWFFHNDGVECWYPLA